MKILLAEDDKNLGRLLQNLLKKENIKTDWVEDGEAAYEQCYRDGYDVLILDWMMPKLDGIALCKRLRAEEYQGKILLLTARDSVEDKVAGLNEGADDYWSSRLKWPSCWPGCMPWCAVRVATSRRIMSVKVLP